MVLRTTRSRLRQCTSLLLVPGLVLAAEVDVLQLRAAGTGVAFQQLRVHSASFGAPLPRVSWMSASFAPASGQLMATDASPEQSLRLTRARMTEDCVLARPLASHTAVLLDRMGNCTFEQQAVAAQHAGAALVVLRDTVAGAFAQRAGGTEIYDCALGETAVLSNSSSAASFPLLADSTEAWACSTSPGCTSSTCVLTGEIALTVSGSSGFRACCFTSSPLPAPVNPNNAPLTIPAVALSFQDGQQAAVTLATSQADTSHMGVLAWAFNAEESPWNASMLLTWALGVTTVVSAAYFACKVERCFSYDKVAEALAQTLGRSPSSSSASTATDSMAAANGYISLDDQRLELSSRHTYYFFLGASGLLLLLYYVHLTLLLSVLFAVGTSAALTHLLMLPLATRVTTLKNGRALVLLMALVAPGLALFWFLARTQPWIWPIQDLLALTLCFVFIDVVRLPSLRVATILLSVAFVYDVFFVYISPWIFGSNVMVAVAAGGGNTRRVSDGTQPHEQEPMPMMISIPLVFSVYGGEALLGLGDIIIPGLLVAFCIRYDYCSARPLSRSYFSVASCTYAVGLLLANAMAIVLRDVVAGQPALMYIVPLMLTAVLGWAKLNSDLEELWDGPSCLQMENDGLTAPVEEDQRHEEQQPLLPI